MKGTEKRRGEGGGKVKERILWKGGGWGEGRRNVKTELEEIRREVKRTAKERMRFMADLGLGKSLR